MQDSIEEHSMGGDSRPDYSKEHGPGVVQE